MFAKFFKLFIDSDTLTNFYPLSPSSRIKERKPTAELLSASENGTTRMVTKSQTKLAARDYITFLIFASMATESNASASVYQNNVIILSDAQKEDISRSFPGIYKTPTDFQRSIRALVSNEIVYKKFKGSDKYNTYILNAYFACKCKNSEITAIRAAQRKAGLFSVDYNDHELCKHLDKNTDFVWCGLNAPIMAKFSCFTEGKLNIIDYQLLIVLSNKLGYIDLTPSKIKDKDDDIKKAVVDNIKTYDGAYYNRILLRKVNIDNIITDLKISKKTFDRSLKNLIDNNLIYKDTADNERYIINPLVFSRGITTHVEKYIDILDFDIKETPNIRGDITIEDSADLTAIQEMALQIQKQTTIRKGKRCI